MTSAAASQRAVPTPSCADDPGIVHAVSELLVGLVQRHPGPHDGRQRLVPPRVAGRELFDDRQRMGSERPVSALESQCTEAERQAVIEAPTVLDRITRS